MIGREQEAAALAALLRAGHHLVTVVGPPGVGKSALATAALERTGLRAVVRSMRSVRRLEAIDPGAGQILLLDDVDALLPSERPKLARLPIQLLATARRPLGLPEERRFPVEPLPPAEGLRLFQDRAPGDEAALHRIIQRLDGLPGLIRAVAQKSGLLSAEEMLERIDRLVPLDEIMTPSWNGLSEEERRLLVDLSVFPGSFSLEACESLLDPAFGVLNGLAEAALLRRIDGRLALFRPVKTFASKKIAPARRRDLFARHATYYLDHLEDRCGRAVCLADHRAVDLLSLERDNLLAIHGRFMDEDPQSAARAALLLDTLFALRGPFDRHLEILDASCSAVEDTELLHRLLRARGEALRSRRRLAEARRDLEQVQKHATKDLEMLVLQELGILAREAGRVREAKALLEQAVEAAKREKARAQEGIVLGNLGTLHRYLGDLASARATYGAALKIHREVFNLRSEMIVLGNLGHLALLSGEIDEAKERYRAALAILEEMPDPRSEAIIIVHLGALEAWRGEPAAAEWLLGRAHALVEKIGDRPLQSVCLAELAALDAQGDRIEASRRRFVEARRVLAGGDEGGWSTVLSVLEGFLDLARGRRDAAQERMEAVLAEGEAASSTAQTEFLRLSVLRLGEAIAPPSKVVPPSAVTLTAARDGSWFQLGDRDRVTIRRRRTLIRIFLRLIEERIERPNESLPLQTIIETGWPGEKLIPHSATTRAYVAISTLRRLGLEEALVSRSGGYLLSPAVLVVLSDP